MPRLHFLLFLIALGLTLSTGQAEAADRVNVLFSADVTPLEQTSAIVHQGATTVRQHNHFHCTTITASAASQQALRRLPGVVGLEVDGVVTTSILPVQALAGGAGTVNGSSVEYLGYGVNRIGAAPGTGINTGAGVVIAIVDTGIDLTHPDLQPNIIGNKNIISPTRTANDDNGHGSHCAGIAAAAHNGVGVIGVAPDAKLLAVKVLDRNGSGYISDVADGITWATDNGAQVISMSLGSTSPSSLIQTAVQYAAAHNVVICCAAGNDGNASPGTSNVEYPAKYPECIAVSCWTDLDGTPAATGAVSPWGDLDESLASFSCTGSEVALTAPGVQIYSDWKTGGYNTISGTSMATPHVAGVAALYIKAGKSDIRGMMAARAEHVTGTAEQVGAGLLRASAWVAPVLSLTAPANGITVYNNAPVSFTATATDAQNGNLSASISWGSNLDGALGTGSSISHLLSVGDHTITASVSNQWGQTASTTRLVHVLAAPTVAVVQAVNLQLVGPNQDLKVTVAIQDNIGNPLAGITFTYYLYHDGVYWTYRTAVTGADGTYTYTQVGPQAGTLTGKVGLLSGPNVTWNGVSPVGTVVKTAAVTAVVQTVNLQLVGANQDLKVTVAVQDSSGNPLAGVTITYDVYHDGTYWTYRTAVTGADGTYTYTHTSAPFGTLTAKVIVLSGPNMTWSGVSPVGSIVKSPIVTAVVHAVSLQLVGANQDLQVSVAMQDNSGNPLAGVTITYNIYCNGIYWNYRTAVTGTDGTYTYTHLGAPAGTLTAKVTQVNGPNMIWGGASPVGTVVKTAAVMAVVHSVNLQLVGPNQDLQVSVAIQDNSGNPLAGVTITYNVYHDGVYWTYRTAVTGADGTYTYTQIGPQAGTLTAKVALLSGPNMTWSGVSPVGTVVKTAAVTAVVQAVNLQLVGTNQDLKVSVAIQDNSGNPLAGVTITYNIYRDGTYWSYRTLVTGADGTCTFTHTGVPTGTLTAKVIVLSGPNMTWSCVSPVGSVVK